MNGNLHQGARVWVSRILIAIGLVCLCYVSVVSVHTWQYQRAAKSRIDETVSIVRPPAARAEVIEAAKPVEIGEIIGRVDIPRLRMSAAVAEGDDDKTLGKAVGHLPDTPLPWDRRGNVAFAAHRDGLFRALEGIRLNDDVRVVTTRGDFHYRVTKFHIVDPDDVWVIAPTETPSITLITCYPFSFIGNAPRRFIVKAELVDEPGGSALKGSVVR